METRRCRRIKIDEQVETHLSEAWEHESGKDEMNVVLQGLEQHFWRGTEAGWLGCYDIAGETWAGDGSVHKCAMGAGSVCLQRAGCSLTVRVGREEEGVSSLRPELAAIARTLQATPVESDLLYLYDSEAALNKMSQWIGSGSTHHARRGCKCRHNEDNHRARESTRPERSMHIYD